MNYEDSDATESDTDFDILIKKFAEYVLLKAQCHPRSLDVQL